MQRDFEYIVLGLGGIGAGAAYWLSRHAGKEVLALEQFDIGHSKGASQDHSRIIRLSYHTPGYVELAKQTYQAWNTLEEDAQEKLIIKTGGIDVAPANANIPISDYTDSLSAANVPFEWLDAAQAMQRWPQWRLSDDTHVLYQSESGIAAAARCNDAHVRMAREYGASLRDNRPITSIREAEGEIEVVANDVAFRCHKLIISAGAWTNLMLAHLGHKLPLTITQEQVTYYRSPKTEDFMPERFPIFIWMDEPCFYGFPVYGEEGVKVAQDVGGDEVTADSRTFETNRATLQRTNEFVQRYIPDAFGSILYTKTCLYTLTPDRDFIIDHLPAHPNVYVAVGAAHAFKFASLIGKILSELAIDDKTASDISPFKFDRPILLEENPPKNFMV